MIYATIHSECHDACTCVPPILEDVWLCCRLLSWGDTKSEKDYHYCQDLAMEFLDEQDIWGTW